MHSLYLYLFLALLTGRGFCVLPPDQLEMTMWTQKDDDGTVPSD